MVGDNKCKHRQQYLIPKRTSSVLQGGQYQLQVKAAVITIKLINTQALLEEKTHVFNSQTSAQLLQSPARQLLLAAGPPSLCWPLRN